MQNNRARTPSRDKKWFLIWVKIPTKEGFPHSQPPRIHDFACLLFYFFLITKYMRSDNEQKNRARNPNRRAVMIFCASFFNIILSKLPKIYKASK